VINFLQNKKFNVVDNYLSEEISDMLYDLFMSKDCPWYFNEATHGGDIEVLNKHYETPQFTHSFIQEGKSCSDLTNIVTFLTKTHKQNIYRLKVNYLTNSNQSGISHPPHLDDKNNASRSINVIIFLNESDGDTVIYKNNQITRIEPKKGRAIFMRGDVFHASNSPVEYKNRVVLNVNILN
tara:strand:- start:365 stop:907 length:543 start_codon:yes stop_codon:yes gene_type:complete